jgi:hypothetical protein
MALEDDAIDLVSSWLTATATFTGTVVKAVTSVLEMPDDFAIIDIAEEGVSFQADGNGSFNGMIPVEVSLVFDSLDISEARGYSSDVRRELLGQSDTRLLELATSQIAMLEPQDSPYAGRYTCQFTIQLFCRP